ncbi:MAG TPA: tripartite tricarboxylate transporter substrate binding protein [Xanthobacteraceae bacterium]|jgi:tripartite-type tricarboxylate transporter receptor subunit TctC|nr:tripartite tricarboxylate transporter substrate binding protein [Xanthobacteraceae bacterium]
MRLRRRNFLRLAAGAAALPVMPRLARAETYPSRPVHILCGFVPGGAADTVARLAAEWLSERLGQQFVVDNRPGAGTNIATEAVVQAAPDGYTLLLVTGANAINATLYQHLNFDFLRDMAPVAGIVRVPQVMIVNPQLPAKTVPEFIAYAKDNPGKINMGSGGVGSTLHVAGELFKMMAGVNLVHVPYRGDAPALVDLMGGQIQVMFDLTAAALPFIKAGKLRGVAVTSAARVPALPDLPTIGDFLPGYEATSFEGIAAPKGTPGDIVDKLNTALNAGFADARFKARLADLGGDGLPGTAADFRRLVADETAKWGKVVKFANLKAE